MDGAILKRPGKEYPGGIQDNSEFIHGRELFKLSPARVEILDTQLEHPEDTPEGFCLGTRAILSLE